MSQKSKNPKKKFPGAFQFSWIKDVAFIQEKHFHKNARIKIFIIWNILLSKMKNISQIIFYKDFNSIGKFNSFSNFLIRKFPSGLYGQANSLTFSA